MLTKQHHAVYPCLGLRHYSLSLPGSSSRTSIHLFPGILSFTELPIFSATYLLFNQHDFTDVLFVLFLNGFFQRVFVYDTRPFMTRSVLRLRSSIWTIQRFVPISCPGTYFIGHKRSARLRGDVTAASLIHRAVGISVVKQKKKKKTERFLKKKRGKGEG